MTLKRPLNSFCFLLVTILLLSFMSGCATKHNSEENLYTPQSEETDNVSFEDIQAFDDNYFFDPHREYDEEAITIAFWGGGIDLPYIIEQYMSKVANVNIIEFSVADDVTLLNTKLMAQDTDIDIFYTMSIDTFTYVNMSYYEDLSQFDILKERFESNNCAGRAAEYDGKYIGVPLDVYYVNYAEVENPNDTLSRYLAANLSTGKGEFKDKDSEELYKVLRFFYDNPDDPKEGSPYTQDFEMLGGEYLIMNPSSQKKTKAAEFLAYCFDVLNGDIEINYDRKESGTVIKAIAYPYLELESTDEIRLKWDYQSWSIIEPLRMAWNDVRDGKTDGSDEALRKLAQDAARNVIMRLEG